METVYFRKIQHSQRQFKSYYVVWKRYLTSNLGAYQKCLNRTMQYGNTALKLLFFLCQYRLNRTMQYGNRTQLVRIYGRTICLNRTMQYGNFAFCLLFLLGKLFKSYYVVWKRCLYDFLNTCPNSLNRTMQYGNLNISLLKTNILRGFKSYYVVWKLFFQTSTLFSSQMFKSYYVVWKHCRLPSYPRNNNV